MSFHHGFAYLRYCIKFLSADSNCYFRFCQFWNLVKLMSTPTATPALFGGGLLGYVMYDCTHYYVHHGQPTSKVPKDLKVRAGQKVVVYNLPFPHQNPYILINEEVICKMKVYLYGLFCFLFLCFKVY